MKYNLKIYKDSFIDLKMKDNLKNLQNEIRPPKFELPRHNSKPN